MLVGDLVIWFYEYLAGIAPDDANPGFKHIIMRPHPVGDLKFVKASFRSPYGLVRSEWQKEGDQFDWQITVPPNTTATVYIPAKDADAVTESGVSAKEADGVKFVGAENDRAVFQLSSGDYHFVSE
jgi:alpha-L-rhamnosidase